MAEPAMRERVLEVAAVRFAGHGYDACSLDVLAAELGIRKQTILYYFRSKEALLEAVVDRAAGDLAGVLESALDSGVDGWERVEALVRAAFGLALRRPEVLGLVREVSRPGTPATALMVERLSPLVERAVAFLEGEMAAGRFRTQDPRLLLVAVYSTVVGLASEVEVLRAVGVEVTLRSAVSRRRGLLSFLRAALVEPGAVPAAVGGRRARAASAELAGDAAGAA